MGAVSPPSAFGSGASTDSQPVSADDAAVVVPALLIVDPKTDRVVNAGRETALADARSLSPQGLADWLAQWV